MKGLSSFQAGQPVDEGGAQQSRLRGVERDSLLMIPTSSSKQLNKLDSRRGQAHGQSSPQRRALCSLLVDSDIDQHSG